MTLTNDEDLRAVIALAQPYYRAMYDGDGATLRQIFDARAPVVGTFDGTFMWQSLDEFITEAEGSIGSHGASESSIDSLQVIGDTAMVAVGGRYWKRWFVDQLAMVRAEGAWRIIAKTFHVQLAEAAQT